MFKVLMTLLSASLLISNAAASGNATLEEVLAAQTPEVQARYPARQTAETIGC